MQKEIADEQIRQVAGEHLETNGVFVIPDIKLSHSGYLIYANSRGIDFLRKVSESRKTSSVGYLLSEFPMILVPGCKTTLRLDVGDDVYDIHVAASRQSGQVGLLVSKQTFNVMPDKASQSS